jgi:hypothetical protein
MSGDGRLEYLDILVVEGLEPRCEGTAAATAGRIGPRSVAAGWSASRIQSVSASQWANRRRNHIQGRITMRTMTPSERALVKAIVNALPAAQRDLVTADLTRSKIEDVLGDGSRLLFKIEGYDRPPNTGQHAFPIEGTMYDKDGVKLDVTLYADRNDRLFELEIIRWGEGSIIDPDLSSLVTY